MRFKIRTIMLIIAAAAVLLFATRSEAAFVALIFGGLLASCVAVAGGLWLAARPFRRVSALGFGIASLATNASCCIASIVFPSIAGYLIMALVCVIGVPVTFGFGAAWSTPPATPAAITARCRALRWMINLVFVITPLTVPFTQWPFRLAFLASQPSLDRLADRVGAGNPVTTPEWAGVFRIVGSAVNPSTGGVGLVTNPDPSGRSGFERRGSAPPGNGPFYNLFYDLKLSAKWRFVEED